MAKLATAVTSMLALLVAGCAITSAPPTTAVSAALGKLTPAQRMAAARQVIVTFQDERPSLAIAAGATPSLQANRAGYSGSAYARRVVNRLAQEYQLQRVTDWYIETLGVHCVVYQLAAAVDREAVLAQLRRDGRIADAQPMQEFRTLGEPALRPDSSGDPYANLQLAIARIGVPAAQRLASGRGVRVAVVDTGLDTDHTDLLGRVETTDNFVDNDAAQYRRDRHGTAVGGAIAANSGNGAGIRGVAPEARLVSLKACWEMSEPAGGAATCNSLTLAAALESAIRRKVHIINLSLTGPSDRLLASLLRKAMEQGILVIGAEPAATGATTGGFPANVSGVITVVNADVVAEEQRGIAAPGNEVLTLAPGNRYDYASGVSISTAIVSGVVALILERAPGATQRTAFLAQLPQLLRQTGEPRTALPPEINAARAIQAALN